MYQFIPLHSCDYPKKISIKINVGTDIDNGRNEIWHWTDDGIRMAVKNQLWVRVELATWYLSRLEHLNGIQWSWDQATLWPSFYSYFKVSFSGEDIYNSSFRYTHVVTSKKFRLK